jgi:uncharacterized membrane protein YhaH (DUF805 family)
MSSQSDWGAFAMHSVQLAVKRLYRIGDFTNNCGRAEFWIFISFYVIITLSLDYITSNVLIGQQTNMLFIAATGIIWLLRFYLFLGNMSAQVARLHDAGYSAWWLLITCVISLTSLSVPKVAGSDYEPLFKILIQLISNLSIIILLLMPTAKSEEDSNGDWQSGVSQISKFVSRKINQGDGFRFLLRQ